MRVRARVGVRVKLILTLKLTLTPYTRNQRPLCMGVRIRVLTQLDNNE